MSIIVPWNYIQMVDDAACLKIAKRNNSFVVSSPYAARTKIVMRDGLVEYKELGLLS